MKKQEIKSMSFEEAENKAIYYNRLDSTGTQVFCELDNKEIKENLILNTMQINDFLNALEHYKNSISFDKKTNQGEYMFKVGLKMGLENALLLWYRSNKYIDSNNK